MELTEIPAVLVAFLVKLIKWFEFKVMEIFTPSIEKIVRSSYAKAGILIESSSEKENNNEQSVDKSLQRFQGEDYVKRKSAFDGIVRIKVNGGKENLNLFFLRVANAASLGLGETYMDGVWDCEDDLTELFRRLMKKKVFLEYLHPWNRFLNYIHLSFFNLQTEAKSWEVGQKHYDLGNELFESFLDPMMTYSCGYWAKADNLNDAQIHKMELIAKKLNLKPGMRVLDIGCGWGGLCKFLAQNYGVECVGITISKEGARYGQELCAGLPVDIRLMDYRNLNETFDRIVSVGMFEHVGTNNHRTYMEVAHRCLKNDDGIFLLHTIGLNDPVMPRIEPWFHTYIFANGCLPYYQDITKATEGLFVLEDWHNFGPDYAKTLHAWLDNFNRNWPKISSQYGDRFYRMWTYYLQSSAGGFLSRSVHLWQVVLSKEGLDNYRAAR